ncbi:MAG: ABC transporter permease [Dehalococcoidales bacterium]|nr:MAG: ABC transporter permease [Dehalococcoidales bacterium]
MNKTLLIFRHELVHTINRKGFIIMTLIVPALALLAIGVFQLVSTISKPAVIETITIGYVDEAGGFDQHASQGTIELVSFNATEDVTAALTNGEVSEYFVITSDYISTGVIYRYTLEKELETPQPIATAIKNFLTSNLLSGKVHFEMIYRIETPPYLVVTRLTETGEVASDQGGFGNVIIPGIFSLLLAFSLVFSSNYLVQGLGDEKESRLIEVLLSSVSPRQLIIGKVLGLGVAGLVQVAVWLASAPLLLKLASSTFGGFISMIQLPANFLILGIVYFILGYSLFAALSTGTGAISPNAREGQQLAMIYTLLAFVPLWFSSLLFLFPNSPIWVALTIFPITAPVAVMLRLGVSDISAWELVASMAVLVFSIIGVLFLVTRAFRTYILMYGKRPGLREIVRSLRQA